MEIIKFADLTPEQVKELHCPMPNSESLKKVVELGVGKDYVFQTEEVLIPARATQDFREALDIQTGAQVADIIAHVNTNATAKFVFRVIKTLLKDAEPEMRSEIQSAFPGWDKVAALMTADQVKHAFAVAVIATFHPTGTMPKESADFFTKANLLPQLMNVADIIRQLEMMQETNLTLSITVTVAGMLLEKVNEIARKLELDEIQPPTRDSLSGATSDDESLPSSSSTDSAEEESPAKPKKKSQNTTGKS